jgi:putative ABC transport system permease protein
LAEEFGVSLGDTVTFNVLGRRLEAEIVNLRVLDWQSLGINFLFMLSPQPLAAAPHGYLATVAVADEAASDLESRLTEAFPNISVVRVQEAVAAVNRLFASITSAVYWASGLTVLVGTLVLVSAFASGYRRRRYEGAVLLAVGTSRGRLFGILALEYLLLGVFAGTIALALALPTAALILTQALEIPPIVPLEPIVASLVSAVGVTLVAGLVTTWRGLGRSPTHWLRNP